MKLYLIAIGRRLPLWIEQAYKEYTKRLPSNFRILLKTIPTLKRHNTIKKKDIITKESNALLAACPKNTYRIAFDKSGKLIETAYVASTLKEWCNQSKEIAFLIGGPDGISSDCLKQCDTIWSLSKLTLPHTLTRILIVEQIYRAWSILSGHPYHK